MATITFTPEDLAANRQGKLTEGQNLRLQKEFSASEDLGKKIVFWMWAAAILLVIVMLVIGLPSLSGPVFGTPGKKREPDTLKWALVAFSGITVACAAFCHLFVFIAKKGRQNLTDNLPVFTVTGIAAKSEYDTWYTLKINDREFVYSDEDDPVYNAFEAGRSYTVYYIFNTSYIIVSAESSG